MKQVVALLICFQLFAITTNATSIEISGNISSNTIWNTDTVNIIEDITIENGTKLTIEPGTKIISKGFYAIYVQGCINATGTSENPIVFTRDDTTKSGWYGIRFDNTPVTNDSSVFDYCHIKHGYAFGTAPNAANGGGLFINRFSKIRIENSLFYKCAANEAAGAIHCLFAHPVIINTRFIKNSADTYGGAIQLQGSNAQIINSLFVDNSAFSYGGAIDCQSNSNPKIINCVFTNNSATSNGSAIRFVALSIAIQPYIVNSVFWKNGKTTTEGFVNNAIYLFDTLSKPTFEYCIVEGGLEGFTGEGSTMGFKGVYANNIDNDPLFSDSANMDYSLSSGSPCINAGKPDVTGLELPMYDLSGNARIYQGTEAIVDIGAYEYQEDINSQKNHLINNADDVKMVLSPNPFTDVVEIKLLSPLDYPEQEKINVNIYNHYGYKVASIYNGALDDEVTIEWNGCNSSGQPMQCGVYYCGLIVNNKLVISKKVLFQK
jgi:predicted outer membrane repeat protein